MKVQGQKLLAAGATIAVVEPALALAHTGGVGAIVGLAAGAAVYKLISDSEKKEAVAGDSSPATIPASKGAGLAKEWSYRLLNGKSTRGLSEEETRETTQLLEQETRVLPETADSQQDNYSDDDYDYEEEYAPARGDKFDLSSILEKNDWRPTRVKIYLARLEDGTDVFFSLDEIVHAALAGATRYGKTSIIRQLLSQLCYLDECVCILLDPHFTSYDIDTGEDWTPFIDSLKFNPSQYREPHQMEKILKWVCVDVMEGRKQRRSEQKPLGKHLFVFIDEYPAIIAECPIVQKHVSKILREGGKYRIHLVIASQDFQVKTAFPDVGGGIRDCLSTCVYVGGDKVTIREILDSDPKMIPEYQLGKGYVVIRTPTVKKASTAFTPFADNEAIYTLLGPSTFVKPSPDYDDESEPITRQPGEARTEDIPVQPTKRPTTKDTNTNPIATQAGADRVKLARQERAQKRLEMLRSSRKQAERVTEEIVVTPEPAQEEQGVKLDKEEQMVLDAYRSGKGSGNAIAAVTPLSATRVNQILNKLSALELIDWKPRAKA